MKKLQILFTTVLLVAGLGMSAAADSSCGARCCQQQGVKQGWFTGAGTLAKAGCDHGAGQCCSGRSGAPCCHAGQADAKAGDCCQGKADGKAGACCGDSAKCKAGECSGDCKK